MPRPNSWREDVLQCVAKLSSDIFDLQDVYEFEELLSRKHPENVHVRDKIRQQLQVLRDEGYIEFLGKGVYRRLPHERFGNVRISFQQLQVLVQKFCEARDWDQFHNPKDLAIGISTEANELLDLFRFKTPEQMEEMLASEPSREHIADELADVFFFLLRFSQINDINLPAALEHKLEKNNEKYPVDKVRGNNLKYTEYE